MKLKSSALQRGFVIPLALIVIAILTVLAVGLGHQARNQLKTIQRYQIQWQNELAYRSLLQQLLHALLTGKITYNTLEYNQKKLPIDGRPFTIDNIDVQLQDISGLLGLGVYQQEWFYRLLLQLTDAETAIKISHELSDWIDQNNIEQRYGMEASNYIQAGLPYRPRNKMIRSLDELLELPSMTTELYNGSQHKPALRDLLVAGGTQSVNAATASEPVLKAVIGASSEQWQMIWAARKAENWALLRKLLPAASVAFSEVGPFNTAYSYRIIMKKPGQKAMRVIVRLTPDNDPPYKIQQWYYPDDDRG